MAGWTDRQTARQTLPTTLSVCFTVDKNERKMSHSEILAKLKIPDLATGRYWHLKSNGSCQSRKNLFGFAQHWFVVMNRTLYGGN